MPVPAAADPGLFAAIYLPASRNSASRQASYILEASADRLGPGPLGILMYKPTKFSTVYASI